MPEDRLLGKANGKKEKREENRSGLSKWKSFILTNI
jgi:hypothetical protein